MGKYLQLGRNNKYPKEIVTWKKDEDIPEWLSDIAKIKLDCFGDKTLELRNYSSGGYEIISSDGIGVLVRTTDNSDYICLGDNKIFSLTPIQLSLLYKENKKE